MKVNKFLSIIFNVCFLLSFTNIVFAGDAVTVPSDVVETLEEVTKILLLVGSAVCIGKIIHIGILFLTSNAMEKSQAKQALLPWVIGTIVCFGAATIGGAIINIFMQDGLLPPNVLEY